MKDILISRQNIYCRGRCIGNANVMKGPPGASSDRLSVYLSVRQSVCLSVRMSVGNSVPLTNKVQYLNFANC